MLGAHRTVRFIVVSCLVGIVPCIAAAEEGDDARQWYEVGRQDVEGQGWADVEMPFDRLPAYAKPLVRKEVWELARHASGLQVRFTTNSPDIWVRWSLTRNRLAMPHMAATGVSGLDLYMKNGDQWQFAGVARPQRFPENEAQILRNGKSEPSEYRLYFPLYNGVSRLEVGVSAGSSFAIMPPRTERQAVFYGTSITQGGCASRPGMSYTAILGRRLDVPIINLGFSGNGKAEPELARLLAELQPAVMVLDPLGNLFPEQVSARMPEFIQILRDSHPHMPIVLNENLHYPVTKVLAARRLRVQDSNARLGAIVQRRRDAGDGRLSIIPAADLATAGGEGTVDGSHPNDLGFVQMADAMEAAIRKAIDEASLRSPPQ